jgi:hypothetical protein
MIIYNHPGGNTLPSGSFIMLAAVAVWMVGLGWMDYRAGGYKPGGLDGWKGFLGWTIELAV